MQAAQAGPSRGGTPLVSAVAALAVVAGAPLGLAWAGAPLPVALGSAVLVTGLGLLAMRRLLGVHAAAAEVADTLRRAAAGDVAARIDPARLGALAGIGSAVNELCQVRRDVHHQLASLRERVRGVPDVLRAGIGSLANGMEEQSSASEEMALLLAKMERGLEAIDKQIEDLNRTAEESSSSILEIGSSVEEVARNTESLQEAVQDSTASLQEIGASIRQMSESSDAVHSMAQESAAAMTEMNHSIQEVEEHVGEAARLTEQVRGEAEEGSRQVHATIEGIQVIRTLSVESKEVFTRLNGRIDEITEIIDVIGGINDETNLLSLNAAIIAAQAGEQGKAFAVVANRVKTLAERTTQSTQEIARLIHAVQEESSNVVQAMEIGIEAVETGVGRSRKAGDALERIRDSAENANTRVTEIRRATSEQALNSKHVTEAAQRTSLMVQQIHSAMGEQSRASEQMLGNAESALEACRKLHRSVEEQRSSGRFISESVSSIAEMIAVVHKNTTTHAKGTQKISVLMSRILEITEGARRQIPELQGSLERLDEDQSLEERASS